MSLWDLKTLTVTLEDGRDVEVVAEMRPDGPIVREAWHLIPERESIKPVRWDEMLPGGVFLLHHLSDLVQRELCA